MPLTGEKRREWDKKYREENKERRSSLGKEWYRKNSERKKEYLARYRELNKEKLCEKTKEYREKNLNDIQAYKKEYRLSGRSKKANTEYRKKNRGKLNAKEARRRAAKLQRTPKWADLNAIRLFYENCPEGMHVDHVVPLQGRTVSGLHVLENLQYLTAHENISKSNRFEV